MAMPRLSQHRNSGTATIVRKTGPGAENETETNTGRETGPSNRQSHADERHGLSRRSFALMRCILGGAMKTRLFGSVIAVACILGAVSCSSEAEPTPADQKQLEQTQANSPDIDASKG